MARFSDWVDLAKSTFRSLKTDDMTGLYSRDWTETRKMLLSEHRAVIDGERRRFRRFLRTVSAILFGLAKRLNPARRLLFVLAFAWFFVCLFAISARMANPPLLLFVEVASAFLLVTALLAMELIGKLKFRDELALARELQSTLIPEFPPRNDAWEIAAFNYIANTVGGDLYDFVPLADGRLAVLFGDASGHGMAAGLVMAVAHASFRTQLDLDPSPAAIIASLNRILCSTGGSRSFFSCCYVLLSPDGTYSATFAGHPQMLRVGASGKLVERIGRGAYPLGIKSGLEWPAIEGRVEKGERLLLHSDGLTEARNEADRDLGDSFVEVVVGWNGQASPSGIVDALVAEWRKFIGSVVPEDDVSITVIERR